MSESQEFWKKYHKDNEDKSFPILPIVEIIKSLPIKSVLELGCGFGHTLNEFKNLRVVGIDISEYAITQAKKMYPDIDFQIGNILDIPLQESFDVVFTSAVVEHVKPNLLPLVFKEMYRVSNKYILNHEAYDDTEHEINWHRGGNEFWTVKVAERWKKFPVKIIENKPGPNKEYWITLVEKIQ